MYAYLCLLALLEECLLTLLLLTLLCCKVLLTANLLYLLRIDAGKIDLVGSGDNIAGVDSSERNTVNLEWAGNKEDTLIEVLEENDARATETTSEKDENGSGDEAWARSRDTN